MNFKDAAAQDIATFLNIDEFADTHTINNVEVQAILDEDLKQRDGGLAYAEGVYFADCTLYVAAGLIHLPVIGELLTIDGKDMIVLNSTDENGVYVIRLRKNES